MSRPPNCKTSSTVRVLAHSLAPLSPVKPPTPRGGFCYGILNTMNLPNDIQDVLKRHARNSATFPYLARRLRDKGWTLGAIAEPLGITRERVRQIINTVAWEEEDILRTVEESIGVDLPPAPEKPVVVRERKESVRAEPLADNLVRLRELQPLAQQVRSNSPKYRAEAEEYTALIAHEHMERGVSLFRLSKELGVTHGALRFRLVRYGYKEATSEHKVYKPINQENRIHG